MADTHAETDGPASQAAEAAEPEPVSAYKPVSWPAVPAEPVPAEPMPADPAPAGLTAEPSRERVISVSQPPWEVVSRPPWEVVPEPVSAYDPVPWPVLAEPEPAESVLVGPPPTEPVLVEPVPAEPVLVEPVPAEAMPAEAMPSESVSAGPVAETNIETVLPASQAEEMIEPAPDQLADFEPAPVEPVPVDPLPAEPVPAEPAPTEPAESAPAEPVPIGEVAEAPAGTAPPTDQAAEATESEIELVSAYEGAAWPVPEEPPPTGSIHHLEMWVPDLDRAIASWGWLLTTMGYRVFQDWPGGRSWRSGHAYIVVEQSPARTASRHDRCRPGMNHLAFHVASRELVDDLTQEAMQHGWRLMFTEEHPFAGGPQHYASYLENADGFEVELVAD